VYPRGDINEKARKREKKDVFAKKREFFSI
jgi:hypothetical protein